MEVENEFEPTALRRLYDELNPASHGEQTDRAIADSKDPEDLIACFASSFDTASAYPAIEEDFYDKKRTDPAKRHVPADQITNTIQFASNLKPESRERIEVEGGSGFSYVDREISTLRTAVEGGPRPKRRPLDLLLVNADDGVPIAAELKIRKDRLPYFALVQAMMYGVELATESQRERLAQYRPDANFTWPMEEGPFIDLWIISFELDKNDLPTYWKDSFQATKLISEQLMGDARVNSVVRKIAYIEATGQSEALEFKEVFGFSGVS